MDANARGIAVLVGAVVIALLLLLKAGGAGAPKHPSSAATGGVTTTAPLGSTTTTPDNTTSTTKASTSSHKPADVKVLVLNGSGLAGVAKTHSTTIGNKGYKMGSPTNATATAATTAVFYAPGYQADAEAVAAILGKSTSVVAPMPATAPGPGAAASDVVVVLGKDTPAN